MKKLAFTIAELVICLMVIGVLAAVTISTMDTKNFYQKSYLASARKIINEFDQASLKIRDNKDNCPEGVFIVDITNSSAEAVHTLNTGNIVGTYKRYTKILNESSNICSTATSNTSMCPSGATRPGGKLPSGAYIAFEIFSSLSTCKYYDLEKMVQMQKDKETINMSTAPMLSASSRIDTLSSKTKCWGRLWVDMNGKTAPNIEGQDVFGFYLGSQGVFH